MASGHLTAIESRRLARRIFRFLTANASATRTSVEQSGLQWTPLGRDPNRTGLHFGLVKHGLH